MSANTKGTSSEDISRIETSIVAAIMILLLSSFLVSASGSEAGNKLKNSSGTVTTVAVGSGPYAVGYDSANGDIYVADYFSNAVAIINGTTNLVIKWIHTGSYPVGVAYDSSNGYIYVSNQGSSDLLTNVTVIDGRTNEIASDIPIGGRISGIAYDSTNGFIYVSIWRGGGVAWINGTTNQAVAAINVGDTPQGVAYNPSSGYLYVTNEYSNDVSVIDGATNKVIATINVQTGPIGIAYDSSSGYIYVANSITGTVSVISFAPSNRLYSVEFKQNGLPDGTVWTVTLNGEQYSSLLPVIKFSEPNGTYSFTATSKLEYTANPASGAITINGNDKSVTITFEKTVQTTSTTCQIYCNSVTSSNDIIPTTSSTQTREQTKSGVCHNEGCSNLFSFLIGAPGTVAIVSIVAAIGISFVLVLTRRKHNGTPGASRS